MLTTKLQIFFSIIWEAKSSSVAIKLCVMWLNSFGPPAALPQEVLPDTAEAEISPFDNSDSFCFVSIAFPSVAILPRPADLYPIAQSALPVWWDIEPIPLYRADSFVIWTNHGRFEKQLDRASWIRAGGEDGHFWWGLRGLPAEMTEVLDWCKIYGHPVGWLRIHRHLRLHGDQGYVLYSPSIVNLGRTRYWDLHTKARGTSIKHSTDYTN